ncbi:PDR/VanB family oxidoreductase [Pseudacidovorax intermedius]|uniref:Vanillate O-demethylase ferredoxin subunit n=1 Tax=Pseudacidovorax intermedius TaxID=433924 RepID=A0A370FJU9_9BURK|nr:PDR/VanB family oxidoreductase [Pseudacidovorax intermedius]RDI27285.1 vanillate O-demethylase ferredoxin subunit [Pseudacidovorax intermedius]
MTSLQVRVQRKSQEAEGIVALELVSADGRPLPGFGAGSHIDVHLPNGLVRQYSLCNSAAERHRYRIAVLREPASRGGSAAVHDLVKEGDVLTISAPRNHFALHDAPRSLLLAGGIGVTPILCMAQRLATWGADFEMHYCTRSPARTAFREEIAASGFADKVHLHHDDGPEAQKLRVAELLKTPEPGTQIYVCGPGGFIDHVVNTAKANGWPAQQIHLEYFAAAAQDTSGDQPFEVKLTSSGQTYRIPKDQTIVQALRAEGVEIMVSCEQGVCGTCITRVLEGVPDHRDCYLTDDERVANDQFTPCCSRSKTPLLVLDL